MKYVSWFIGLIVIVLAVIFGVILIRNTVNSTLNGSARSVQETLSLNDYAKEGVTLRLHVYGPIVATENHREIQADITSATRALSVIRGYDGEVIKRTTIGNTLESFKEFASALDRAGFTVERSGEAGDPVGACATGSRYQVQVIENGKTLKDLWRTTCTDTAPGNFGGSMSAVAQLFRLQYPDYQKSLEGTLNNSGLTPF